MTLPLVLSPGWEIGIWKVEAETFSHRYLSLISVYLSKRVCHLISIFERKRKSVAVMVMALRLGFGFSFLNLLSFFI